MKSQRQSPWETFIIAASFIAVWIYFGARIWAGRSQIALSPAWQLLLLPCLILLAMIFVRRVKRVLSALRGEDKNDHSPSQFPPRNGHAKR